MSIEVHGTGVLLRLATNDEVEALVRAAQGGEFELHPPRSFMWTGREQAPNDAEIAVVSQAFVEFTFDTTELQRWESYERHGHVLPLDRDATLELLELAIDTYAGDIVDLLADLRIAKLRVSRWDLMSAPRRFDLAPGLAERLAPLRRG